MWPNLNFTTDLVTFFEENFNRKINFYVQYKLLFHLFSNSKAAAVDSPSKEADQV